MINSKAKLVAVVATLLTTAYAGSANAYYSYNYGSNYSQTYYIKGDTGPRGYNGYTGATGARGATGAMGPKGAKGDAGPGLALDTYVVRSCTVKTNDANCDGYSGDLLGFDENGNPRDLYVEASCGDDVMISGGYIFKPNPDELELSAVTHDLPSDDGSKWIAQAWIAPHAYAELTAYAVCLSTYHTYDYNW